jgi:cell division protein FtsW (lipid II flippase)
MHMPVWKVLVVMLFGLACLCLAIATVAVPMTLVEGGERWLWLGGLFLATGVTGALFALFLRSADRAYGAPVRRY